MKGATERKVIRWVHILLSIPVLGYIYGPVATLTYPALATKFIFLPIIVLSGFWLWKGHWIKRQLRRKSSMPLKRKPSLKKAP
ncbi:hypothetical protein [Olivibacter domesticus]|uniref:PepSY-associated TM region n=1 Tax=Olivibacter domesticus TaxID=407022 RepID=A0A1H7R0F3_OLID1|nr:hypothetical protein [Olivibacter domesticus]SEL53730.1 hypothetical protein SAMN05661044_02791 [Olivibacter domesticus]